MRSIDELIDSDGPLGQLRRVLADRQALLRQVRAALPDGLASHCIFASLDGPVLRLLADSAGWATRLRYLGPALARQLGTVGLRLSVVEVRVVPPDTRSDRPIRRTAPRSDDAAQCLEQTADTVADPALRAALLRLGHRLRR